MDVRFKPELRLQPQSDYLAVDAPLVQQVQRNGTTESLRRMDKFDHQKYVGDFKNARGQNDGAFADDASSRRYLDASCSVPTSYPFDVGRPPEAYGESRGQDIDAFSQPVPVGRRLETIPSSNTASQDFDTSDATYTVAQLAHYKHTSKGRIKSTDGGLCFFTLILCDQYLIVSHTLFF